LKQRRKKIERNSRIDKIPTETVIFEIKTQKVPSAGWQTPFEIREIE
jgi:hypothetical protein